MGFVAGLTMALGIHVFAPVVELNVFTFAVLTALSSVWLLTLVQELLDERSRIVVTKAELMADARDLELANLARQDVIREI